MVKGSPWLLNEDKLAEIIAATVLALDVSLSSAIGAGERVSSHQRYGRTRPDTANVDRSFRGISALVIAFRRGLASEDIVAVCSISENHRQGDDGADEKKRL